MYSDANSTSHTVQLLATTVMWNHRYLGQNITKIQLHCPHLIWLFSQLFSLPNQLQACPPCCLLTCCFREFVWECYFGMRADHIIATRNLRLTKYCQSAQDDELLSCNVCLANLYIIIVYYMAFWNTWFWLVNMVIQIMKPTRSL